jgi:hypothetical protein
VGGEGGGRSESGGSGLPRRAPSAVDSQLNRV